MNATLTHLGIVLAVAVAMFGLTSFVLIRSNLATTWKFIAIPAAFVGAALLPLLVASQMGFALPMDSVPEQARVFQHRVLMDNGKKAAIELWVALPKQPTKLISVPYTKELEKLLQMAEGARRHGLQTELRRGGQKGPKREGLDDGEFHLDLKKPKDLMPPKDVPDEDDEVPSPDELFKDGGKSSNTL